jgi:acyl carrier protein
MSTEHEQGLRQQRSEEVVLRAISDVNQLRPLTDAIPVALTVVFRGEGAALDSLALVNLLVATEDEYRQEFAREISLAPELVLPAEQSSFRSAQTLADHLAVHAA